jgi:cellulose synthase/poly-beta-1,6-N-acetylglucosamine synthase-like glycosyltransferase
MTQSLFIIVWHMNNLLQIWEGATYLQSEYATQDTDSLWQLHLHVSIAKFSPDWIAHEKQISNISEIYTQQKIVHSVASNT